MRFRIYSDPNGYWWQLVASNGRTMATSDTKYLSLRACQDAIWNIVVGLVADYSDIEALIPKDLFLASVETRTSP